MQFHTQTCNMWLDGPKTCLVGANSYKNVPQLTCGVFIFAKKPYIISYHKHDLSLEASTPHPRVRGDRQIDVHSFAVEQYVSLVCISVLHTYLTTEWVLANNLVIHAGACVSVSGSRRAIVASRLQISTACLAFCQQPKPSARKKF